MPYAFQGAERPSFPSERARLVQCSYIGYFESLTLPRCKNFRLDTWCSVWKVGKFGLKYVTPHSLS